MGKIAFKPTKEQVRIFKYVDKRHENLLIEARAGCGKCLGIDTPVLMYDGSIKPVQDIEIGDILMGDDSQPRKVLSTNTGYGELFNIIPVKGDSWVCNDVHVMTLHDDRKKTIIDIPLNKLNNHLRYPNNNLRNYRLQRTGVEFNEVNNIVDPYLIGLWLGDGDKTNKSPKFTINENDKNIISYLKNVNYDKITPKIKKYKSDNGCYSIHLTMENYVNGRSNNILKYEFDKCKFNDTIGIPKKYLINSREKRLRLLGGLIDSDGHYSKENNLSITTKYDKLKDDILFLCRSLGFSAYSSIKKSTIKSLNFTGYYHRINISGDYTQIFSLKNNYNERKQIKNVLRTGFKYESIGFGNYYGFTLDGNGRFLLGDFTITHNTSTIVEATKLIPKDKDITFLAFNKHIQEELKEKLPENVRCYTMHGLGAGAILRKYPKIKMDEFKVDHIIKNLSKKWKLSNEFKLPYEEIQYMNELKKYVNLCRLTLTMDKKWMRILGEKYDMKYIEDKDIKRISSVLEVLMNDRETYDFTDMVFLPAIDPKIWLFPQDFVIVDECQDLNRAQQKMIEKMLKRDRVSKKVTGRLIAVGDPFQSIYSFAGSDNNSFDWFRKYKNTKVLPLTYTFRCAKDIVKKANEIVEDIKPMDDAPEGQVRRGDVIAEAESGDFVLCRTVRPLIALFFTFLLEGKKAMIKGSDVGLSLIEMTKDQKTLGQLMAFWENELSTYRDKLKKRGILNYEEDTGYAILEDRINTLVFLAKLSNDIADLRSKISVIFTDDISGIMLSTVHKAKGLEANRVFIIRPDLLPMGTPKAWQYQQEKNLEYVAITRAKLELVYDYEWNDEIKES